MRNLTIVGVLIWALSLYAVNAAAGTKVQVCHIPPGDPMNFHTITISLNALAAHLAHGDAGGSCDANCALFCDDGDPCTVDDTGDCEELGCPAIPEIVDCNDGNLCTTDSCNSSEGCVNELVVCNSPNSCTISICAPDTGGCVDSPIVCDDGQVCNEDTGECDAYSCSSDGRFCDHGDGTVSDTTTGLMWAVSNRSSISWYDSITYCDTYNVGNYTDWRMPTTAELQGLYSAGVRGYNEHEFIKIETHKVWSSNTYNMYLGLMTAFYDFLEGHFTWTGPDDGHRSNNMRTLPVRTEN